MLRMGFVWLAGTTVALSCTPSRPSGPTPGEARTPVVSVTKPPPPAPTASQSASASPPPARPPEAAGRDAGPCTPLDGQPGVVSRGSNQYVQAKTPAECKRCNGDWGPHGLVGVTGCLCRTPDANKPCDSPHDCVAECLVDRKQSRDAEYGCPHPVGRYHGHCAERYTTFGCHGFIIEKATPGGPLQSVRYLCLD